MELRHLEYFVKVVESGSFSAAASALDLAQPTLSRQIAQLESELQQRLFSRTGRGVAPTPAGTVLLGHARSVLQTIQLAKDELRDMEASPVGRVVVGLPPRISVAVSAGLIQRFRERMPKAVLSISEGLSANLKEWLISGRLDVALLFDPPPTPSLLLKLLLEEPLVLVGRWSHEPMPEVVRPDALIGYPLVLPSPPNSIRSVIDAELNPRGLQPNIVAEVGGVTTVLTLVAQGVGYSILPESVLRTVGADYRLRYAKIGPPTVVNRLFLALPRAGASSRLLRETQALLRKIDYSGNGTQADR